MTCKLRDGTEAEIEAVLATATVARTRALPPIKMGEGMLDRSPFSRLRSSL
jgi:hypothetical protein